MGIFGKKKTEETKPAVVRQDAPKVADVKKPAVVKAEKTDKKVEKKSDKKPVIKGSSVKAYDVLLKPLITEKASELGALNKYIFAIDPKMNKIEVKKAIRKIYEVDPADVNILNFPGKSVRYGKTVGKTKKWKKAVVTLRKGDSIQVYEGV